MKEFLLILLALFLVVESSNKKYTVDRVQIEILHVPDVCDYKSKKGDILTTDYIGTFPDGRKFDSTYDRNQSMTYFMGNGDVIKGCEIGTMDMCKGEKIIIPPDLAYGDKDYGQIPAGSTLHFDIVLTNLQPDPFKAFEDAFKFK